MNTYKILILGRPQSQMKDYGGIESLENTLKKVLHHYSDEKVTAYFYDCHSTNNKIVTNNITIIDHCSYFSDVANFNVANFDAILIDYSVIKFMALEELICFCTKLAIGGKIYLRNIKNKPPQQPNKVYPEHAINKIKQRINSSDKKIISVIVINHKGDKIHVSVNKDILIIHIKILAGLHKDVRMIFAGKQLNNFHRLTQISPYLYDGITFHVVLRLGGLSYCTIDLMNELDNKYKLFEEDFEYPLFNPHYNNVSEKYIIKRLE